MREERRGLKEMLCSHAKELELDFILSTMGKH